MAQGSVTAKVEGGNLILTLPIIKGGRPSKSGKTTVFATTNGNQPTTVTIDGKPLIVGVNAYTK